MKNYSLQRWIWVFGLVLLAVISSEARVGGGDSYGGGSRSSGGSHSYGGSGSGNGGGGFLFDIIYLLIRLCFIYPAFGIPIIIVAIFLIYRFYKNNSKYNDYYSSYGTDPSPPAVLNINRTRDYIDRIVQYDSNFSFPIFKDFVFSLYHSYHENRGAGKLDSLSAFFEPQYLKGNSSVASVQGVVIGNCTISRATVNVQDDYMTVEVGFSANYTELDRKNIATRYKLSETWKLRKSIKVLSPVPDKMTAVMCPNCGAPITETVSGVCSRCNQTNKGGRFLWYVYEMDTAKEILTETSSVENEYSTMTLVDYGVRLPTLRDPEIESLVENELSDEYDHIVKRAEDVFLELQKAWTQKNWALARPYETDTLFHTHMFWIEDLKRNGQTNFISNVVVDQIEPVSLVKDQYYTSLTFRIFANMIDYTLDRNGKILRGHRSRPVKFSEYWTFIKGINSNHKQGKTRDFSLCPSCGANLKIEMSGVCDFCGTKVTLGQFDWVLSQIEQDEEFAL